MKNIVEIICGIVKPGRRDKPGTFDLSNVSESELSVLVNMSVLPAVYIPIENICEWMKLETKNEINTLEQKGWLKREKGRIFMHQVIQEVIRHKKAPDVKMCKNLIFSLGSKLYLKPGDNPIDKKEFVIYADSILQHIDEKDNELATLANNLSQIYLAMGQYEKALKIKLKGLKIEENALDKNNPQLASSYNNLATIYQDMGQLEKALEIKLKGLKIEENVLDKNHPNLAASYHNLSFIYSDLGQLEKALPYSEKAVAIMEFLFPDGHPNLDVMKDNLDILKKR